MHNHIRKPSPYIFYGQTTSLCETCYKPVPAKILFQGDQVYYQKRCSEHGVQKTLVSSDADYFKMCKEFLKPGDRPLLYQSSTEYGCPLDCGLCPDHEQHSCVALIEINDQCNLSCPVCFAESSPQRSKNLDLTTIEFMMDTLVASEGEPDVLQISGGEPTLHPQFFEILSLAKAKPIRHLMVNTNGIKLASDKSFVERLSQFTPGFEIYLQFDSLKKDRLINLRGVDLRSTREKALRHLEEFQISTTLVVTVKKGINDDEIGDIIHYALEFECIRGITFQPVQDSGRNEGFDPKQHRVLLTDIRKAIAEQTSLFKKEDIIPLPCNPESIAIAYAIRQGKQLLPLSSLLPRSELVKEVPNAVSFEKDTLLKEKITSLLSLGNGELKTEEKLASLLCCLPQIPVINELSYKNVFRLSIVEFLDRYNFCVGNVKRSCLHFITPKGQIIPFDTYNTLYRNGLVDQLRSKQRR